MTIVEAKKVFPAPSNPNFRIAELPYKKRNRFREYSPSRTELLLEELCHSFGTELLPAYVDPYNGVKLVRLCQPVNARNEKTGKNFVLTTQCTRFSPLFNYSYMDRVIPIYWEQVRYRPENSDSDDIDVTRRVSREIERRIREQHRQWDSSKQITDPNFIPDVPIHRWPKTLYFSAFAVDKPIEGLVPFFIHEGGSVNGNPPDINITFRREPFFVRRNLYREDTTGIFDTLKFNFPAQYAKHESAFETAESLHHLSKPDRNEGIYTSGRDINQLRHPRPMSVELHSSQAANVTLAFIATYLRSLCLGRSL